MWALITGKEKDVKHSTSLPSQNSLFWEWGTFSLIFTVREGTVIFFHVRCSAGKKDGYGQNSEAACSSDLARQPSLAPGSQRPREHKTAFAISQPF